MLGLRCGVQDLQSLLWHAGSLVAACKLLVVACGIVLPGQGGIEPGPLHWENKVLAIGPPIQVWLF